MVTAWEEMQSIVLEDKDAYHADALLWCLHCERAFFMREMRCVKTLWLCAHEDCDGDLLFDVWLWAKVREFNPEYPERPEPGKVYPLYGP